MSSKFIPSLQAALNVCLYYVFGQRCLMGCHSLPRQYYTLHASPLLFSSIFFSLQHVLSYQTFLNEKHFSLYSSPVSVAACCLFTIMVFFFPSCSVWHICCCTVGRLHSPVINLFCRSPSAPSHPPPPTLRRLLFLLQLYSLHWHLMHGSLTPHFLPAPHR